MAWEFVGISAVVETTTTALNLVEPAGVQSGDLLVACVSFRGTAVGITWPSGWTVIRNGVTTPNTATNTSAIATGAMGYIVRGASAPALNATLPAGISVALARIAAYRGFEPSSIVDVSTAANTPTNTTPVNVAGMTTTVANALLVGMAAGGQETPWNVFDAATDPGTASTATNTTSPPTAGTWYERADSVTTSGADTSLGVFDAVKSTAGATGNFTVTATLGASHCVIVAAFKPLIPTQPDAWSASDKGANITLTNGDKTATASAGSIYVRSTTSQSADKRYIEFVVGGSAADSAVGLKDTTGVLGQYMVGACYTVGRQLYVAGNAVGFIFDAIPQLGDVLCLAWDADTKRICGRRNNTAWWPSGSNPETGTGGIDLSSMPGTDFDLYFGSNSAGNAITLRTEVAELAFPIPAGFRSWMGELADAWSAVDKIFAITLSNNDKTATLTTATNAGVRSTQRRVNGAAGKYYAEFLCVAPYFRFGIQHVDLSLTLHTSTVHISDEGNLIIPGGATIYLGAGVPAGGVVSIAWDSGSELLWARVDARPWNNNPAANPATGVGGADISAASAAGEHALWVAMGVLNSQGTLRTEKDEFTQTTPAGFMSWMGETLTIPDMGTLASGSAGLAGAGIAQTVATGALVAQSVSLINPGGISGSTGTGGGTFTINLGLAETVGAFSLGEGSSLEIDQGFIAAASQIHSINLACRRHAATADGLSLKLLTSADVLLGEAIVAAAQIPTSGSALIPFVFPTPISVTKGTSYKFLLARTGAQNASAYYNISADTNIYADGILRVKQGITWYVQDQDLVASVAHVAAGGLTAAGSVRTNLLPRSQELSTAPWAPTGLTITPNNVIAPDGTLTADTFADTAGNAWHYCPQLGHVLVNATTTFSFYAKAGTADWFSVYMSGPQAYWANFNIRTGTHGMNSGLAVVPVIVALANGWYRCSITKPSAPAGTYQVAFFPLPSDMVPAQYTGTGIDIHVWGGQLETAAVATAYIPTLATAQTVSDTLSGTGTASWAATGALVAGQLRTNYAARSQEFNDTSAWSPVQVVISANVAPAPDSTTTAERIAGTGVNGGHYVYQTPSSVPQAAGPVTYSVYAKAGTTSWFEFYEQTNSVWAYFNVLNGVVGTKSASVAANIVNAGNGWYRCSLSLVTVQPSFRLFFNLAPRDDGVHPVPNFSNSIYIDLWGAQAESGLVATDYIPTADSAVTVGTPVTLTGAGTVTSPPVIGTGTLTTGVAALASNGTSASVGSGAGTTANISVISSTSQLGWGNNNVRRWSQTFIAPASTLTDAAFWVGISGAPSDGVVAKLYTVDGAHLPATLLATSNTLPASGLSDTAVQRSVQFTPNPAITIGVEYALVIERTGALDANNYYLMKWGNNTYPSGELFYNNNTGGWSALGADLTCEINFISPGGLVAAGIARTNLVPYSQELGHAQWAMAKATRIIDAVAAPNGTMTAETFTTDATAGVHGFYASTTIPAPNAIHTHSIYAKAGTGRWLQLYSNSAQCNFDLVNGVKGYQEASTVGTITAVGDGWYRCSITKSNSGAPLQPQFFLLATDSTLAGGDHATGGLSFHMWGAQSEQGAGPTAYIPTTATAVTVSDILVGTGISQVVATGALVASTSTLAGIGTSGSIQTSGALQATMLPLQNGSGLTSSTGTAALVAPARAITGAGLGPSWVGTGALTAVANSRGNFLLQSQTFHHATWTKSDATISADVTFSPPFDLTGTADLLADTVANTPHYVLQSTSVPLVPHTFSVYAKAVAGSTWLKLMMSAGAGYSANFNLVTGAIGNTVGAGTTARMTAAGNGWYRCSITSDVAFVGTTCNSYIFVMSMDTSATTYPGAGLSHYIWGAQLERSSAPTTYLPTVASAVTFTEVLTGAGTAAWSGTGALPAQTAALTGAGVRAWAASGTLATQSATTVAPGVSSSTGTATLPGTAATMSGLGSAVTGVGGTGTFAAQSAISVGAGISRSVGILSAALGSQSATMVAPGLVTALGAGVLPRAGVLTSAVTGAGAVASVGTAAINAQAAVVNSTGNSRWVATGALPAQASSIAGVGVIIAAPSGTGALAAQASTVVSAGAGFWRATGALPAGSSAIVASGVARWSGTGAIAPSASAVAGAGVSSSSIVSAALFASTTSLNGFEGVVVIGGTGAMVAQSHVLDAVAVSRSLGTGALADAGASAAGVGLSRSLGSGSPVSQAAVIASLGVSRSQGIGALPSPVSTLAGAGVILAAPTGTGTLVAQPSEVIGVVVAEHVAAGVLSAQAADVTSIGLVRDPAFGTGALAPSVAAISGAGNIGAAPSGVGVLAPYSASLNGQGVRQWVATGALASKPSTVAGVALQGWIATGSLVAQAPVAIGTGVATWAATGALPSGAASIAGAGLSRSTGTAPLAASRASVFGAEGEGVPIEGIGELQAQSRVLAGAGFGRTFGFGSLVVPDSAVLAGLGASASRGPGALAAGRSDLEGTGAGLAQGVGALAAGAATLASTGGVARWAASGALQAGDPQLTGIFASGSRGTGVLAVADPVATGLGISATWGDGALGSRPAAIFGSAFLSTQGAGELEAQSRVIVGTGISLSRGTGVLRTDSGVLSGAGRSEARGTGAIIAKPAKVAGFATLTAYGVGVLEPLDATISGDDLVVGAGVLDAAVAEVASAGDVGEYIPPPPTELPGSYPGTETWYGSVAGAPRVPSAWWLKDAA